MCMAFAAFTTCSISIPIRTDPPYRKTSYFCLIGAVWILFCNQSLLRICVEKNPTNFLQTIISSVSKPERKAV